METSPDQRPHVNYIIVEVRERDKPENWTSDAAVIRKIIHEFISEHDLYASTMISRWDRQTTSYGGPQFWDDLTEMFKNFRKSLDWHRIRR